MAVHVVGPPESLPALKELAECAQDASARPRATATGGYEVALPGAAGAPIRLGPGGDAIVVRGRDGSPQWATEESVDDAFALLLARAGLSCHRLGGDLEASRIVVDGLAAAQDVMAAAALDAGRRMGVTAARALPLLVSGSGDCAGLRRLLGGGPFPAAPGRKLQALAELAAAHGFEPAALGAIGELAPAETSAANVDGDAHDLLAGTTGAVPERPIGFVGIGAMGGVLAEMLVAAGVRVIAWDVDAEALRKSAAEGASSPEALAEVAELIVCCLPTSQDVEAVAPRLTQAGRRTIVDMTTGDPRVTRAVGGRLAASGHELIDAAISGGILGARSGTMSLFVGGSPAAVTACGPLLALLAPVGLQYAGPLGSGHAMKLVNNYLAGVGRVVLAEALTVAALAGADPAAFLTFCDRSWAHSHHTHVTFPACVIDTTASQHFRLALMLKDLRLAEAVATADGAALPGLAEACEAYEEAIDELGPDADVNVVPHRIGLQGGVRLSSHSAESALAGGAAT